MTRDRNSIVALAFAMACSLTIASHVRAQGSDDCTSVTPQSLAVGSFITLTGDNTAATSTNDFAVGSPFTGAPVMWHSFTTTECANVSVSFCGQSPAWGNVFGFLSTDCPADSLVYFTTFNTTDCGDGNYTYFYDALAPGTYNVPVVLDPGNNSVGPYSITVTAAACSGVPDNNDFCDQVTPQALAVDSTLTFTGDNSTATSTNDFAVGSPYTGAPVFWHSFTTTECANVSVSFCGQSPAWGNVFGFLSTDCPADSLVYFTTFNTTDCGDGNYTYFYDALAPGTYNVPVVLDPGNNSVGPYSITVTAAACSGVPDNNDFCDQVTPQALAVDSTLTFTGDNSTATSTNDFAVGSPYTGAPVFWHSFTTTECANVSVSFCGQSPAWGNVFGFLSTDCPADSLVYFTTFNTTDCGDGNYTYFYDALAPGTYNVPVVLDPGNNSVGPYSITVTAAACSGVPDNNDFCDQVTPQALAVDSTLTFTGDNSTATSTNDFAVGSPFTGAPVMWHSFTTTECANVSVSFCGQSPAWGNVFGFLSTDCPADSLVYFTTFNTTDCGDGNVTYFYNELAAGTYNVPVVLDPGNNSVGPYSMAVTADACISTGVHDQPTMNWSVFPDPAEDELDIVYDAMDVPATIELIDLTGRVALSKHVALARGEVTRLLLGGLGGGTYILRLTTTHGSTEQRVMLR